ncbi:uncharacterized protein K460DRAFT_413105 [Cucurbitaria berberidis CBS 394.84]|uniref:GPI anchored protein n=1 Tax=Cucurbitaria berberidis CBS 394.84 TaxID=1168544 RepID=A0A9P4GS67_9PLEO|nr:uncharacterized protein K460DRAFT_413105 [Cucurbitaria berberidis CBS 394.84]KAF1851563.1 hypothetical protein K460DRAFT_413105 [Cucurbitaria berberidis CBS 394.84]
MHPALLFVVFSHVAFASLALVDLDAPSFSSHYSTLKPATRHRSLSARNNDFSFGQKVELAYADHYTGGPVMSSHIHLEADRPTLLLEDFDHHLTKVECHGSKMSVSVRSGQSYRMAKDACTSLVGGLLISSHHTCGDNGAHTIHRVINVSFDDKSSTIVLDLEESIIEKEFHTVTISFGQTDKHYIIHKYDRLYRRAPQSSTIKGIGRPSSTFLAAPTESVVTQIENTVNKTDLGFDKINTTFFEGEELESLNTIQLGCANCTAKGEMIVTTGKFKFDFGAWFKGEDDDPVKSGFIQLDIKGFEMSIGLKATPSEKFKKEFTLARSPALGPGFNIPKIGHFGVTISLVASIEITIEGAVELGFGFDVKVPDSVAKLDAAELQDSYISGFNQTEVSLKPLSANVSNLEFSIAARLRPKITVGLSFLGASLEGGPYVSLPEIKMNVTQLATDKFGADCNTQGKTDVKFKDAFKNLTHVDYGIGLAAGFGVQVGLLPFSTELLSPTLTHTTQCLAYQTAGTQTGLVIAKDVLESMTHKPTPSGAVSGKTSKAVHQIPEFQGGPLLAVLGVLIATITFLL